jgi:NADPH2:quinone reductase
MKAAFVNCHGPADSIQIGEVPDPQSCSPDEVIVAVNVTAVNPIDTYIRSGAVGGELPTPWIPGCDFAGRVLAIGAMVTAFQVGDRVWGSNQSMAGRQGTLAEQLAVHQQWVYLTPDCISDEAAAAGALTGITAHLGLYLHAQLKSEETVFVNGGTGGVGSAVVQLARRAGARVITTVGNEQKATAAKELGAEHVINYRVGDLHASIERTAEECGGIDVWFETLRTPEPERVIPLMSKRGRIVVMAGRDARPVLPVGPLYVADLRIIGFAMFNASPGEQRQSADAINSAGIDSEFESIVGRRFALNESAAAHQLQEDNTLHGAGTLTGKIVVQIAD